MVESAFPRVIANLEKNRQERLRIALDQYQGVDLIDIRVTTRMTEATDVWSPTKKGLSLRVVMLPDLIAALQRAEADARALGLIGGAA